MKRIVLIISICIFSIFAFEFFLRFSPFSSGITPMVYDKNIGMWHKKDFSDYIVKSCYKREYFFDKEGRIQNNYEYNKNKKDIVLLGDSQIEALMVQNQNIVHNKIYDNLAGKYNVLNYGLSGTGPTQQLEILKHKVNIKNIKELVHFVFIENDLNDGDPQSFDGTNRPKVYLQFKDLNNYTVIKPKAKDFKETLRDFLGNFELYVYLKKTFYFYKNKIQSFISVSRNTQEKEEQSQQIFEMNNYKFKQQQMYGAVYQISKLATQYNFNYTVIYLSSYVNENILRYKKDFEIFLSHQKIVHRNLFLFLNTLEKQQKIDFKCDGHWNDNTHNELANYLVQELSL